MRSRREARGGASAAGGRSSGEGRKKDRSGALDRPPRCGPWTRAEIAEFKRLYGTRTDLDLGRIFGRSVEEIERCARQHALAKDKRFRVRRGGVGATRMPRWRSEEIGFLEREYAARSNLELARILKRSVKSLASQAHHLGLKKSSERLHQMGQANVRLRWQAGALADPAEDPGPEDGPALGV